MAESELVQPRRSYSESHSVSPWGIFFGQWKRGGLLRVKTVCIVFLLKMGEKAYIPLIDGCHYQGVEAIRLD